LIFSTSCISTDDRFLVNNIITQKCQSLDHSLCPAQTLSYFATYCIGSPSHWEKLNCTVLGERPTSSLMVFSPNMVPLRNQLPRLFNNCTIPSMCILRLLHLRDLLLCWSLGLQLWQDLWSGPEVCRADADEVQSSPDEGPGPAEGQGHVPGNQRSKGQVRQTAATSHLGH